MTDTENNISGEEKKLPDEKAPQKSQLQGDRYIWGIFITLCLISVVEVFSACSQEIRNGASVFSPIFKHVILLIGGGMLVYGIQHIPYKWFRTLPILVVPLSIGLVFYTIFFGDYINGARRSFTLLGISVQPAELAKLAVVLSMAYILARNQVTNGVRNKAIIWCLILVAIFSALLITQGLTNTLLLVSISGSMMLIGGVEFRKIGLILCVLITAGAVGFAAMSGKSEKIEKAQTELATKHVERSGTWKKRLEYFFVGDSIPEYSKPTTSYNRQQHHAAMALANGGAIGVFPGNSRENSRLPLAYSDFIYAIIIEDTGFIGGLVVMFLYISLLIRAGLIARKCTKAYPALLIMGIALMIAFQALFHMAIVVGVFPVSGQPLPLISKGGSSMIIACIGFGMMLSVSRTAIHEDDSGNITENKNQENIPEDIKAINPTNI